MYKKQGHKILIGFDMNCIGLTYMLQTRVCRIQLDVISSLEDIVGAVCSVCTYCGFSNGHDQINTFHYW